MLATSNHHTNEQTRRKIKPHSKTLMSYYSTVCVCVCICLFFSVHFSLVALWKYTYDLWHLDYTKNYIYVQSFSTKPSIEIGAVTNATVPLKISRYIQIKIDNVSFDSLSVHSVSARNLLRNTNVTNNLFQSYFFDHLLGHWKRSVFFLFVFLFFNFSFYFWLAADYYFRTFLYSLMVFNNNNNTNKNQNNNDKLDHSTFH